ncbi:ATP-binding protein [Nocardiopsis sp. FIRDI 009]|uniref:ATP-binding protein n=1 Tax=Nocardiopsis sp. FIRDI 009 TaxID=714197 RepID=UPI000E24B034|nr:ATP-binding protein [Nocardiopsis sp. FIRDI 009]
MTAAMTGEPRPVVFWEPRVYQGELAELAQVRNDLARDLTGFDPDLVETVKLCASELHANCAKYTDQERLYGEVIRGLSMPDRHTVRLSFSDSGGGGGIPRVPIERTDDEWSWAEGQRGLLLVENLAREWGHLRLAPWGDLGTCVWATFDVDPATAPSGLRPFVFTD